MIVTQANRQFKVATPLGPDVLLFHAMTASEQLSRMSAIRLDVLSTRSGINPLDILGAPVAITIELPAGGDRHFHAHVADFAYVDHRRGFYSYRATLRPWPWFLTKTADCRIFQHQSTPDIIKSVFRELGFTDFKDTLSRSYEPWEYCVQYRETAFDFVSRLMEHEGIYYYFEHTENKHILVLADAIGSHKPTSGYENLPYYPPDTHGRRKRDHVSSWSARWDGQSGKYSHRDFDFKQPRLDLLTDVSDPRNHAHAQEEIYDYPGIYTSTDAGGSRARVRIDEIRSRYRLVHGAGDARGLATGALFTLSNHPRDDQNREYLLTSTICEAASNAYSSGGGGAHFGCKFTAMSSAEQFRPARLTPKPLVHGPQTAFVVGPAGEEIHTDEHGRIMVQFHRDRKGKRDENSSCWMRVAQTWAHGGWGSMFIPRIGMEVVVEFLEGDPDRPIVTGCVYNGANKPPYPLPGEKTKSTIKSNSSKGGGGYNEIRFEDKKGSEEIWVHAQKDRNLVIEHDETTHVGHDRTETVDNDETITIKGGRTVSITKNDSQSIGKTLSITAGDEIIVTCGEASIDMKSSGDIVINGANITIKGSGNVVVKGAKILEN